MRISKEETRVTTFYFDQNEDSGYDISNAQKSCHIAKEKVDQYVQVGEADDSNNNPILLQVCLEIQKQEKEALEKTYRSLKRRRIINQIQC